jgi:signal transduction histidine kinase
MYCKLIDFPTSGRQNAFVDAARIGECGPLRMGETQPLLPEIEEALFQAHKTELLGQMAGGLAHNFNNLLQGVMSAMNLMQNRASPSMQREFDFLIGHAAVSVNRVGALTQRLLAFVRPQPVAGEAVEVNSAIDRMRDLLLCTMLPEFQLNIALDDRPMTTWCDPRQLEIAILDLVLNARDAMPRGGTLTVKTGLADMRTDKIGLPPGRYVSICVGDTGMGMPPESLVRVFDPLYTTRSTGQRTGLGLPLAKLFVERFQGYIAIDSVVGTGTFVQLYLPMFRSEANA